MNNCMTEEGRGGTTLKPISIEGAIAKRRAVITPMLVDVYNELIVENLNVATRTASFSIETLVARYNNKAHTNETVASFARRGFLAVEHVFTDWKVEVKCLDPREGSEVIRFMPHPVAVNHQFGDH